MTVARLDRIAMFDLDIIAVAAEALGAADGAVGGGVDRGAVGRRNVDAVVARDAAGDGMNAHPVGRGQRHLLERLARGHRNAEGRGEAGVEALPCRSEEHTSELQSLMRISYAVFCLKKKK